MNNDGANMERRLSRFRNLRAGGMIFCAITDLWVSFACVGTFTLSNAIYTLISNLQPKW